MIRLLLVDDHAVVTEGLSMLLAGYDDLEIVGTAQGGAEAVLLFDSHSPDVVLMDLSMPDIDGVEATRRIVAVHPDARILALTGFIEEDLVSAAITAGARGYLLKNVGGDDLADAIRTVAAGQSILSSEALPHLTGGRRETLPGGDLTPREFDVLEHLVKGMSNKQIASELGLRHGTIRIHVSNILAKLHVENRTAAAHVARSNGVLDRRR